MHREGKVCGHLEPQRIVWDNHSVNLVETHTSAGGAYLAPEQIRGEDADARSDIFAFGAIVYELLAGQRAFPAHEPEELNRQILEVNPPRLSGVPEGIASLVSNCLQKNRDSRLQRINSIVIELKLANASAKQIQSASEWRDRVLSLRSQVAAHDEQLAAQQIMQEALVAELRDAIQRIEGALAVIRESIAGMQRISQVNTKAIEGLQVAASQTDEVVEHVVEAFGMMQKSVLEHGDAQVLLVAGSGA